MDYYLWAIFPIFGRYTFIMALTAMNRTGIVALIIWLEVGFNIILNYGLIFGKFGFPAMGIRGAGLVSIIVYRFIKDLVIRPIWKLSRNRLRRFFRHGWPKSLELLTINAIFSVFALLAGWIDTQAVVANTIALQTFILVSYTLPQAVADVVAVRVSGALARNCHPGAWRAINSGIAIMLLLLSPLVAIFWNVPE